MITPVQKLMYERFAEDNRRKANNYSNAALKWIRRGVAEKAAHNARMAARYASQAQIDQAKANEEVGVEFILGTFVPAEERIENGMRIFSFKMKDEGFIQNGPPRREPEVFSRGPKVFDDDTFKIK